MKRQSFIAASAAAAATIPWWARISRADMETLKDAAAAKGIVYGSNFHGVDILESDPAFAKLTMDQVALMEDGHHFEWIYARPSPTTFQFDQADAFVNWAQSHGKLVQACHLMWHKGLARWERGYINSGNWRDLLTTHIKTMVGRYAGKMYAWVVVNEAINPKDGRSDYLRSDNLFVAQGGQDAIDLAFQTARAADPKPYLIYNDYGVERDKPDNGIRRKAILSMVEGMLKRNIPITAVGVQAHLDGDANGFSAPGLTSWLKDIASLGLKIMITEMDIGDKNLPSDDNERDSVAAKMYTGFLNTVLQNKSVISVVQWSYADKYYWRNDWQPSGGHSQRADGVPDRGLPFGFNLEPTPIFNAILDAFEAAPKR
jgi:endo-1,4-beta-xylanase